jgi:hypothetical protein
MSLKTRYVRFANVRPLNKRFVVILHRAEHSVNCHNCTEQMSFPAIRKQSAGTSLRTLIIPPELSVLYFPSVPIRFIDMTSHHHSVAYQRVNAV